MPHVVGRTWALPCRSGNRIERPGGRRAAALRHSSRRTRENRLRGFPPREPLEDYRDPPPTSRSGGEPVVLARPPNRLTGETRRSTASCAGSLLALESETTSCGSVQRSQACPQRQGPHPAE